MYNVYEKYDFLRVFAVYACHILCTVIIKSSHFDGHWMVKFC